MSFLAPLYGLAALLIALPILFHLVRRRPKDTQAFSSLMFLEPAPPRLTRNSRIENWLLLLLRALAIILLAVAFSRPYWNVAAETESTPAGMRRMILLDTSASMRRGGLWDAAKTRAEKVLSQATPSDITTVYAFDRALRPIVSIDEADITTPSQRVPLALSAIRDLKPTWHNTDLGTALVSAADLLQMDSDSNTDAASETSEIVLISDFQNGMLLEGLSGYSWPLNCRVRIERVEPEGASNARASILDAQQLDDASDASTDTSNAANEVGVRVRVFNQSNSIREDFQLCWIDEQQTEVAGSQMKCKVPAGSGLVVRMPALSSNVSGLKLTGDQSDFDNLHFVAKQEPKRVVLPCVDGPVTAPESSLSFFLERVPLGSPWRTVTFERRDPNSDAVWPDPQVVPLIVASHQATKSDLFGLQQYVAKGGNLLWVLDRELPTYAEGASTLFGDAAMNVSEGKVRQYAMLEQINFRHPLFAELSSSRFNDFTKVRFWKYRDLKLSEESKWNILARFDSGSPALVTRPLEKGNVWILAAGWQPNESQLALSSKFVPIISNLFRLCAPEDNSAENHVVGDTLSLAENEAITTPEGLDVTGPENEYRLEEPGIYERKFSDGSVSRFPVNLAESESLTSVADLERLERLGVGMADQRSEKNKEATQRQLRAVELEAQQSWWRWLVVGVLGAAGIESLLCIARGKVL
jgi:hypothetical protein